MEPKTISNFVIEKRIGAGGQGQVFKGYEKLKNHPVAIKLIGRLNDSDIEKEISILQQLRHPNVIQLIGVEKTDDYYYIIMEYCEHGDLGQFIEKKKFTEGKMPECQVQRLFQQVVCGLHAMHKSNVVHRDLKPENILIGENFIPKICDFGVSKERRSSKTLKTTLGTSIYMAPEVICAEESGESYDEKCDIWSLGIMLYKVLMGTFPYPVPKGYSFDPLLKAINETNPLENVQTLSEPLLDLLKSMLTVDPKNRIGYSQLICHRWVTGFNLYPSIKFEHPSFSLVEEKERVITLNGDDSWVNEFSHEEKQRYYKRLQEKELIIDYRAQSQPIYQQKAVTVYYGLDCDKKREIAIKILKGPSRSDTNHALLRESRILSKLDHPNIIKCFGSYKDSQGNIYLIYEWCSNGNLESFINQNFRKSLVPEHQAQKIVQQLFAGMKILKENSLRHQDLQLKNILVNESFNLKLAGFNSVYEENESKDIYVEKWKELIPTTAPEVFEKGIANDKCEIWSLGVILYQILTGRFPFKPPLWGPEYILKQVKQVTWPQLSEKISLPIKSILSSMLTVDVAKRTPFQALFTNPWISGSFQMSRSIEVNEESKFSSEAQLPFKSKSTQAMYAVYQVYLMGVQLTTRDGSKLSSEAKIFLKSILREGLRAMFEFNDRAFRAFHQLICRFSRDLGQEVLNALLDQDTRRLADLLYKITNINQKLEPGTKFFCDKLVTASYPTDWFPDTDLKFKIDYSMLMLLNLQSKDVQTFLDLVATGQQQKAEQMLKSDSNLALARGTITDPAKKTFNSITGFQYAVWALDWHMWKMIRKYLTIEAAREQAKEAEAGSWVEEHGQDASWAMLNLVSKLHGMALTLDQKEQYWVQEVGGAQLKLPIHILQEYSQPDRKFDPCPNFRDSAELKRNLPEWLQKGYLEQTLSKKWVVVRGNGDCRGMKHSDITSKSQSYLICGADWTALKELSRTRIQQRGELVVELMNQSNHLKISKEIETDLKLEQEKKSISPTKSSSKNTLTTQKELASRITLPTQQELVEKHKDISNQDTYLINYDIIPKDLPIREEVAEKLVSGKFLNFTESKAIAAFVSTAVGNSLGFPLEGCELSYTRKEIEGFESIKKFFKKPDFSVGKLPADACHALCVADSLIEHHLNFEAKDLRTRFLAWWLAGYNNCLQNEKNKAGSRSSGLGNTTFKGFEEFFKNNSDRVPRVKDLIEQDSGNGSIVRLVPIVIAFHTNPEKGIQYAHDQSFTTHNSEESAECARFLVHCAIKLFNSESPEKGRDLLNNIHEGFYSPIDSVNKLARSEQEKFNPAIHNPRHNAGDEDRNWNWRDKNWKYSPQRMKKNSKLVGIYSIDAACMSLHLLQNTSNFKDAMLKAVNLGGDADSIGGIIGMLGGCLYGLDETLKGWYLNYLVPWDDYKVAIRAQFLYQLAILMGE